MQPDIRSRVASSRLRIVLIATHFLMGVLLCTPNAHAEEKTYYFLYDHLGSVDVVLDEEGDVVERADYEPFGEDRLRVDGDDQPIVSPPAVDGGQSDYKYTGKEMDSETGLYYYGARYYDPLLGRFVSEDPWEGDLSNPQTLNKYSYVLNNPFRFTDPTGMYEEDVHYDLTYFLGLISGLDNGQATRAAFRDQYMDENPDTKPTSTSNLSSGIVEKYHFATRPQALEWLKLAIENKSIEAFGDAMHSFQDTYSHFGLTPFKHSILSIGGKRNNPDKTYSSSSNIAKANRMARASFFQFRKLNFAINGAGNLSRDNYLKQSTEIWNRAEKEINSYLSLEDKTGSKIEVLSKISK